MTGTVEYPPREAILEAHQRLIELYGGAPGIRNAGGVEAALARAQQIEAYGEPSIFALATAIAFGLARIHHPFVDGNKRVAFFAAFTTLWLNGWRLDVAEQDAAETVERMAAGDISEDEFAGWLRQGCRRR